MPTPPKTGRNTETASGKAAGDEFRMTREIIESLAIALVLALLFKTFLIELFVIPTGSMAPTLMGFHKDVVCPHCATRYKVNASEEFPEATGHGERHSDDSRNARVLGGTCPQCGASTYFGKDNTEKVDYRSYPGDRILVSKYNYLFRSPKRWNVTVFRYPGKAQANYIKRLIGLENETIRIKHGDIFVRKDGEETFTIQRKPTRALEAMLQLVYDNDHAVAAWHRLGWPTRWQVENEEASEIGWTASEDYRNFNTENSATTTWLHYRHLVPSSQDCLELETGHLPDDAANVQPLLITDFTPYNAGLVRNPNLSRRSSSDFIVSRERHDGSKLIREYYCSRDPDYMGLNWVGDLLVSFQLTVADSMAGLLQMKLVKGGHSFVCQVDLNTGYAELTVEGMEESFGSVGGETPIRGNGTYQLQFANIDEELRLWVDGREIAMNKPATYDALIDTERLMARDRSPTELDLRPVSIGVRGAAAGIAHLKVMRDLYYIAADQDNDTGGPCDLLRSPFVLFSNDAEHNNRRILSTPVFFSSFGKTRSVEFHIGHDEFFMLGDNSAMSKDSRLWTKDGIPAPVPRKLLVGEALLVYWPHGLPIPGLPLNLIPNVRQMRLID